MLREQAIPLRKFDYYNNPKTIMELLNSIPFFDDIEVDIKSIFAKACTPWIEEAGQNIVKKNNPPDYACIIISGLLQVEKSSVYGDDTAFFAYRGPAQNIGIHNAVLNMNHKYSSKALTRCCYLRISRADIINCYNASNFFSRKVLRTYIDRLDSEVEDRERMRRLSEIGKVAATFLQIAKSTGIELIDDDVNPRRLNWLRQKELEKRLRINHVYIGAAYKALRKKKAISGGSGVHDPVIINNETILREILKEEMLEFYAANSDMVLNI